MALTIDVELGDAPLPKEKLPVSLIVAGQLKRARQLLLNECGGSPLENSRDYMCRACVPLARLRASRVERSWGRGGSLWAAVRRNK